MDHAITVGDVLLAMGVGFGVVAAIAGVWFVGAVNGWWMT